MCGRYTQTASPDDLMFRFGFSMQGIALKPHYNLAPVSLNSLIPFRIQLLTASRQLE